MKGPYYTYKVYATEILESCNQINNVIVLYTCTMPQRIVFGICLVLFLDHTFRVWNMWQPWTIARRNRFVLQDALVDFFCLVFPLVYMWFWHAIPLTTTEMIMVTGWPSLCLLLKVHSFHNENIRRRWTYQRMAKEDKISFSQKRRRQSIFRMTEMELSAAAQAKAVPPWLKKIVMVFTMAVGVFFLATGIVSIVASTEKCNTWLWGHCAVKAPFCNLKISCNCAVLKAETHNITQLPESIESMTAMKMIHINNGPLMELPEIGNYMPRLAKLNVDFNELRTLPASLGKIADLTVVYAAFNRIASIDGMLQENMGIVELDLSTNNLVDFPNIRMRQLLMIALGNNSLTVLPDKLFESPFLVVLNAEGNRLTSLPPTISRVGNSLWRLVVSRNNISSLPSSISAMKALTILDLRNNSLSALPSFDELISLSHLTVSGNPLCANGWQGSGKVEELMSKEGEGCARQCSDMCLNIMTQDLGCDFACNVAECHFDNGKCQE